MNKNFLSQIITAYPQLKYALLKAQTFDPDHFGFPEVYYKIMETDEVRVGAFRDAFRSYDNLRDATVCEVGVGTLALTQLFLPYVKKAYLIESNPNLSEFIKKELKQNGWDKKTVFIEGDALQVELPEQVDFIIGENMSIYCANEHQVQIFQHLRRFLKPSGKLIPEKIINWIQLGNTKFDEDIQHYPIMFSHHLPTLMTDQKIVNTINLYQEKDQLIQKNISVKALLSGTINCAYLNSWVQCAEGANFTGTDSLMPPTVVKLKNPVKVKGGEQLSVSVSFRYGTSLDEASFHITGSLPVECRQLSGGLRG
ncbi:MAG: methyltransferase domain-containing protein [Bacteroidota bacterium]